MPCDADNTLVQACSSGIGKIRDPLLLQQLIAQLTCEAGEGTQAALDGKLDVLTTMAALRAITPMDSIYLVDDFVCSIAISNVIALGSGGWVFQGSGNLIHYQIDSSASNPGTVRLGTGNTSGQYALMAGGHSSPGLGFMRFDNVGNWEVTFIFKLVQTSNTLAIFGLVDEGLPTDPPDGFYLKYDSNVDGNFNFIQRQTTETSVSSGVAADTAFHRLTISSVTPGVVNYQLDNGTVQTINDAGTRPNTTLHFVSMIYSRENANKYIIVDYFRFLYLGIPPR
jgi:hypothetical protein